MPPPMEHGGTGAAPGTPTGVIRESDGDERDDALGLGSEPRVMMLEDG